MNKEFIKYFKTPPQENSMAPFWFLNDDMEPEHLCWQLQEMVNKGIYEVVLHARKGLTVAYLSDTWFERIGIILDEAKRLKMRVFIYDEDNWPSGYAGGRVVDSDPEFAARCLGIEKIIPVLGKPIKIKEIPDKPVVRVIAAYCNEEFFDITGQQWASPALQYEVFVFRSEKNAHRPAYSDKPYVDLLNKKATERFIEVTHAEYKRRFPMHWGSTIKGFFTDEPGFYQNYLYQAVNLNTIPWTEKFPEYFKQKNGYDIMPYLGAIWDDMGELSKKTRRDYFTTLITLYSESFFCPIQDFLAADGLLSIGHLHMEEHLSNTVPMEGDFFAAMQHLDFAGIDCIDKERNRITEKLGSSAMHLQGKKYCFSETYGCFGWALTLEEMKRTADWQYVQGVNKLIPHAFFSSIEGVRATECPPSEFYQNTFWSQFGGFSSYISRLSYALSEGNFAANTLVYYPIKSCHELFQPLDTYAIRKLDEQFIDLSLHLLKNQIDFDYLDDTSLQNAKIDHNYVKIQNTNYRVIILPPLTFIPKETVSFFIKFAARGGFIIDLSGTDILEDIQNRFCIHKEEIKTFLAQKDLLDICLEKSDTAIKYQHRKIGMDNLYFIINEEETSKTPIIRLKAKGNCTRLDPLTGKEEPIYATQDGEYSVLPLPLEGYGSALIYFAAEQKEDIILENWKIILSDGTVREDRLKPWTEYGQPDYSGAVEYNTNFIINENADVTLDLGLVCETAEISVNNKPAGSLLWRPYRLNISDFIKIGENSLTVTVRNTPSNKLTGYKKKSGLIGPVKCTVSQYQK